MLVQGEYVSRTLDFLVGILASLTTVELTLLFGFCEGLLLSFLAVPTLGLNALEFRLFPSLCGSGNAKTLCTS